MKTSPTLGHITVATDTIDASAKRLGVDRISFLKLDVEGFELEVLKGAQGMLSAKRISGMLFENNVPILETLGKSGASIFDLLMAADYRVLHIDGREASRDDLATMFADFRAVPRN